MKFEAGTGSDVAERLAEAVEAAYEAVQARDMARARTKLGRGSWERTEAHRPICRMGLGDLEALALDSRKWGG